MMKKVIASFLKGTCTITNGSKFSFSGCKKNKNNSLEQVNGTNVDSLKPPVDGSASEFFGRKPTIEEIQKLLSPAGFLSQVQYKDYDGLTPMGTFEQLQPAKKKEDTLANPEKKPYLENNLNEWGMPEEVGFKVKGPEPTRYGDWERKGRATDF